METHVLGCLIEFKMRMVVVNLDTLEFSAGRDGCVLGVGP